MKKLMMLASLFGFMGAAHAADITIYYSPTCPHCHHALEFFSNTLVYEYPELNVTSVNVTTGDAAVDMFRAALEKCEYTSGGVPVIVVGDKCFQGYAEFMNDEIRDAVNVGLTDDAIDGAKKNRDAMTADADAFRAANASRANAIAEFDGAAQKKTNNRGWIFWGALIVILGIFAVALGHRKDGRK